MTNSTPAVQRQPRRAAPPRPGRGPGLLPSLRRAIKRCREGAVTMEQALATVRDAARDDLGFARVVVCSLDEGVVTPVAWTDECEPALLAPCAATHDTPEAEIARRRDPLLVSAASLLLGDADGWVGAALTSEGIAVGLIVADRSPRKVGQADAECLGVFAEAASCLLERSALGERARSDMRAARAIAARIESCFDHAPAAVSLRGASIPVVSIRASTPRRPEPDHRLVGLLTTREREVMELMASGARNGQIAARLVISEGTVKSHVKNILRKLRANNRAEAVARYVRLANLLEQ